MGIRKETFYLTDKEVQQGDEYYVLKLNTKTEYPAEMPFKVSIFHGKAGDGNRQPESETFYASGNEAEDGFTVNVNKLLERGFQYYTPAIHGDHDF